jgi:N-acetyl-gamma-glutamyl-phosphate reductase
MLAGARRIAVPGCNVTAVTLALAPGIASGYLDPTDLTAVLANGVSGAGRAVKPHLLAAEILGAASPYAVGGTHRHIPEILQNLRRAAGLSEPNPTLTFIPTLVPMTRGILATCTARLTGGVDPSALRHVWERAYGDEPFITLLREGRWPTTAATAGANTAHIQVTFDPSAHRAVIVAALDNLVKGTAGAAIQCLTLAFGLPEGRGLTTIGLAP